MSHRLASRIDLIESFKAMDVREAAWKLERAGRQVIHMEVGEPSFSTMPAICRAASEAVESGHTQYAPALGLPALRECIAAYYADWHGVQVAPERIVITAGASGAFVLLGALLLDPDDEMLLADPGYPCYRYLPALSNARPRLLPCGPEAGFQLTLDAIRAAWSTRSHAVLLASPSNPTGTMVPRGELAAIAEWVNARDGTLIVDEIYQGLTYPSVPGAPLPPHGQPVESDTVSTALQVTDDVVIVNSFSKYFGMTGWRLGWIVVPEVMLPGIEKLAQNFFIAASTPAQHGALEAFTPAGIAELERRRGQLCERRNAVLQALQGGPMRVPVTPNGAFYIYGDVAGTGLDSVEYCRRLLQEQQVALTPGVDFGSQDAERYVRMAFTASFESVVEAARRINAFRP